MLTFEHFIGGGFRADAAQPETAVFEPATGRVYAQLHDASPGDIDAAVAAASDAFPGWSTRRGEGRAAVLHAWADQIESAADELAAAESRDTGKPVALARAVDIPRAITNLRFFAAAATQFSSESHQTGDEALNLTLRQPLGPVACISPWNLPLYLLTWKIAPALAAGCTVVAKPSEVTPATATMLAECAVKAGLPGGVFNLVHGRGDTTGARLVEHPGIEAVSFTGSTRTGAAISHSLATRFKKLSLEMGGKNPFIVFDDADVATAAATAARAAFTNQGQICLCGSRLLVADSIYDEFVERLLEHSTRFVPADPADEDTTFGALVSEPHFKKVLEYVERARTLGGTVLTGGEPVTLEGRCAGGWFVQPTIIEGLDNRCDVNQEEIFGPVVTLQRFEDERQAVELANDSAYGLAASIFGQDIDRCLRTAKAVQCGIVWINCWMLRDLRTPFGGSKHSGVGREGGWEAMRFFTEPRNVCIATR